MLFNLQVSLTDLSLFGLRRGGQWVGIGNYLELLTSSQFRRVLFNTTVWLTLIGVSVRIVLGVALALLINCDTLRRYRLRTLFHVLLIVPWATPPIGTLVVWRWMPDPRAGIVNRCLVGPGTSAEPGGCLAATAYV